MSERFSEKKIERRPDVRKPRVVWFLYLGGELARLLIRIAAAVAALVEKAAAIEAGRARLVPVVVGRPVSFHDHRGQ